MADEVTLAALLRQPGGIGSDAQMPVAPVQRDPGLERKIQVWTMSGREPTPDMVAYLKAIAPEKEAQGERLAMVGAEASMIPQALRAGSAIGEAARDPSLPNITNAGVQTAFTALRPVAAAKMLGAGYAGAIADQFGMFNSSAEAQTKKGGAPKVVLPGLTQEQQSFYDAAEKRLREDDFSGSADRRQVQQQLQELRTLSNDFVRENAASERRLQEKSKGDAQAEYNRQVEESEAAFKDEMSRNKRFDRTPIGEMYEKTGGYAPFLFGTAAGTLFRAGAGPNSMMTKYVGPTAAGAVAGAFAPNAPTYYNSTHTPPDNPKKRAYEARAEALPPNHPRRQEYSDYAKSLPEENPVRKAALEDFTLANILKRSGMGAAEGAIGGFGGGDIVNVMGRTGSAMGSIASRVAETLGHKPPTPKTTPTTLGGILREADSVSPKPTAPAASSDPIPPGAATGRSPMAAMLRDAPDRPRLAERIGAPDPVPQLSGPSSQQSSPDVLIRTTDSRGIVQHRNLGGKYASGPQKGEKTKVVRKGKIEEASPEKPGVQIDDTKPIRYED